MGVIKKLLKGLVTVALVVVLVGVGYVVGSRLGAKRPPTAPEVISTGPKIEFWTCSMHPNVKRSGPGQCPICAMDLVPVTGAGSEVRTGMRQLPLSEEARALMEIETAQVQRKFVTATVRMLGKVEYDETRLAYLTAWVPGRLDRLYVDYTGVPVRKGDHMVLLYSPDLLSAQQELLQAIRAEKEMRNSTLDIVRETTAATVKAAREKLRLWGLTPAQVAEIEKTGKVTDHLVIYAPTGGIVIQKNAQQGMYVQTGTRIYAIADLSHVWVKLDAYESDLMWLRYGQKMTFTSDAYPGETFTGTISFIDPVLDEMTRTVKVRVDVDNRSGKLKPGMFVRGEVEAQVAAGGRVMDPVLAGKWICPMHPSVVRDHAGDCDICGMPLVTAESLGYVSVSAVETDKPMVIPVSAALVTGKRAVVYVETGEPGQRVYEGREVVLGPRAGDYYLVVSGLVEGDRVVTRGNFKIDSELQIQARPSMMSPESGSTGPRVERRMMETPEAFREALGKVYETYHATGEGLFRDDVDGARKSAGETKASLDAAGLDPKSLETKAVEVWREKSAEMVRVAGTMETAADIQKLREGYLQMSGLMAEALRAFGSGRGQSAYRIHCPMAFGGQGGDWVSMTQEVRNPYFGPSMPACGDVVEVIVEEESPTHEGHAHE